ncbi:hypothetical protein SAMN05444141_1042 [Pseudovibrio denitrificans]|uniref:Uncharacterized protein n=1 Tax=Pseudovibrio denitrificans TaxID=258256 RepID=A0A1I7BIV1_9HYPH|nr:hypothetical protein [Pseudovibrio denitrificans]SFT87102.1 hypothetical protein SAMN05444141_1042 [Pseudovibrio denitrificans]
MGALNKCALLQLCVEQIPVVVNAWDDAVKQGGDGLVVGDRQVMVPADGSHIGARTAALSDLPSAHVEQVDPTLGKLIGAHCKLTPKIKR